jgi:hypothetical protein
LAQGVPGRLRPRIFLTFGTTRVVGRQPYAPAAFTAGEISFTHFLEAESTPGHMGVYMYKYIYICTYIFIYIYMCSDMYMCIYIYIYIYALLCVYVWIQYTRSYNFIFPSQVLLDLVVGNFYFPPKILPSLHHVIYKLSQ